MATAVKRFFLEKAMGSDPDLSGCAQGSHGFARLYT